MMRRSICTQTNVRMKVLRRQTIFVAPDDARFFIFFSYGLVISFVLRATGGGGVDRVNVVLLGSNVVVFCVVLFFVWFCTAL